MIKVYPDFVFATELLWCLLRSTGAVAVTGRRLENQTMDNEHGMFSWPVIPNATAPSFSGSKKVGPGFRCHAAQTYSSIFAAEQNTDHRQKKCPPQEQAFLLTFLALKKV